MSDTAATATATIIVENSPQDDKLGTLDPQPFEIRWGFNPVQRNKMLSARECGMAQAPVAKFFPIRSFSTPAENHTIDWTQPRESLVTVSAADAMSVLKAALAGDDGSGEPRINWGAQFGFIGERDIAKMAVMSSVVVPDLATIRRVCEENGWECPITAVCAGSDEMDFGGRNECTTCWSQWLASPVSDLYIESASLFPTQVAEYDPATGATAYRDVTVGLADLTAAKQMVQRAFAVGINTLKTLWGEIAAEYEREGSGRRDVSNFEHSYRKDIHASRPQDRQIALIERFATATKETRTENDGALAAALKALAEAQIASSSSQAATNKLIEQMAEGFVALTAAQPKEKPQRSSDRNNN